MMLEFFAEPAAHVKRIRKKKSFLIYTGVRMPRGAGKAKGAKRTDGADAIRQSVEPLRQEGATHREASEE